MIFFGVLLLFLANFGSSEYVPGEPGAPWTDEEVLIVKAKLFSVFNYGGAKAALNQVYDNADELCAGIHLESSDDATPAAGVRIPTAAKFLRLGFHDCLKYEDGSGGCDGCLNWEGVGTIFTEFMDHKYPDIHKSDNNGLACTVYLLEHMYTNASFPAFLAPELKTSLKNSGKSRADLWAFASIAAVEYGIMSNNLQCDGTLEKNPEPQCTHDMGTEECKVILPRKIDFKTGRRDCMEMGEEPFISTKHESHPHITGNGEMTIDFFQKDFGMNGKEMVAILGSHTMGRFHRGTSLFKYTWTTRGESLFNNHYYRNIVREPRYGFQDNECTKVTDAEGNVPLVRWTTRIRRETHNGGPVQWIKENYSCDNCADPEEKENNICCQNVPEGQFCHADSPSIETDPDINSGCEHFHFVFGRDEAAMSCEIGLYFDFKVEDGIPYGCPGMETFNADHWDKEKIFQYSMLPTKANPRPYNKKDYYVADPQCPPNTRQVPEGSMPLNEIFELFAKDQNAWLEEFVPAFEKMISNGYDDLVQGPNQFDGIVCNRGKRFAIEWEYTNCYHESVLNGPQYAIKNNYDGRALYMRDNGQLRVKNFDSDLPEQRWIFSGVGDQLINVKTGQPLVASQYGRSWKLDDKKRLINTRDETLALDRDASKGNNALVRMRPVSNAPRQKWTFVEI